MVNKRLIQGVACAVVAATFGPPCAADGILEQMEKEVVSIAQRAKSAVVTIEEGRIETSFDFSPFSSDPTAAESRRKELETRLKHLQVDKETAEKHLASLQQRVNAGVATSDTVDEDKAKLEHIKIDMDDVQSQIALLQVVSVQNDVRALTATDMTRDRDAKLLADQIERLQARDEDYRSRLADLLTKYKENHPQVRSVQEQRKALESQLDGIRNKLSDLDRAAYQGTLQQNRLQYRLWRAAPKSGSGFSIGDGYIVTTADVLEGMKHPVVVTDNGTRIKARALGINSDLNVGLVKLEAKADLPALKLGDSDKVAAGQFAISVGNQTGQANSVALMLVGGLRTESTYSGNRFYPRLIQIAGTVGAGTSGAPLVNSRGEVIGMMAAVPVDTLYSVGYAPADTINNYVAVTQGQAASTAADVATTSVGTSLSTTLDPLQEGQATQVSPPISQDVKPEARKIKETRTGGAVTLSKPLVGQKSVNGTTFFSANQPFQNFFTPTPVTSAGFAVPINEIKPALDELRSGKPIVKGWIGIDPRDETKRIEQDGIIKVDRSVKVQSVYADSPALRGGLQPGDTLISINGKPVRTASDVREVSIRLRPGNVLTVEVKRQNGEAQTITLKIEPRPAVVKPATPKP